MEQSEPILLFEEPCTAAEFMAYVRHGIRPPKRPLVAGVFVPFVEEMMPKKPIHIQRQGVKPLSVEFIPTATGWEANGALVVELLWNADPPPLHTLIGEKGLSITLGGKNLPGTWTCEDGRKTPKPNGVLATLTFVREPAA